MAGYKSIVISREMGSGGSFLGYYAAKELGFKFLDREILYKTSSRFGVAPAILQHHEEKSSGILERIIRNFSFGAPESAYIPPIKQAIYDKDLFLLESKVMNSIIDQFNAVIVGRGGFYALRNRHEVLRIFVHAPLEFRIKRVMEVRKTADYKEIKSLILESDRSRAKFVKDILGVNWTDSKNFHLCIDSSVVDFHTILEIVKKFF